MKVSKLTARLYYVLALGCSVSCFFATGGWCANEKSVTLHLRGSGKIHCEVVEIQPDKVRARQSRPGLPPDLANMAITYSRTQIERAESEFADTLIREASQLISGLERTRCEALNGILKGLTSRQTRLEALAKNLQWLLPEVPRSAMAIEAVIPGIREAISVYEDVNRKSKEWKRMVEGRVPLSTNWEAEIQSSMERVNSVSFMGPQKQMTGRLRGMGNALATERARETEPFFAELRKSTRMENRKVVAILPETPPDPDRLEQLAEGVSDPELKKEAAVLLSQLRTVLERDAERKRIQEEHARICGQLETARADLERATKPADARELVSRLEKTTKALAALPDSASRKNSFREIGKIREAIDMRLTALEEEPDHPETAADRGILSRLKALDGRWVTGALAGAAIFAFLLVRPGKSARKKAVNGGEDSSVRVAPPPPAALSVDDERPAMTEGEARPAELETVSEVQPPAIEDSSVAERTEPSLDYLTPTQVPVFPESTLATQDSPLGDSPSEVNPLSLIEESPFVPTFPGESPVGEEPSPQEAPEVNSQFDYLPTVDQIETESRSLEKNLGEDSAATGEGELAPSSEETQPPETPKGDATEADEELTFSEPSQNELPPSDDLHEGVDSSTGEFFLSGDRSEDPDETSTVSLASEDSEGPEEEDIRSTEENTTPEQEPGPVTPVAGDPDLMDVLGLGSGPPPAETPPLQVITVGSGGDGMRIPEDSLSEEDSEEGWTPMGINSRKYFDSRLPEVAESSQRNEDAAALLLIALDGVSYLSEEEWLDVRPQVLETIGETLRSITRTSDLLAWYEEDKFALAIYPTITTRALPTGLRIRETIRKALQVSQEGSPIKTVSVGLCCLDGRTGEVTSGELIRCAEHALRAAIRKGGNQVVLYGFETE